MPVAFTETTVTLDGETIGTLDPDTRTSARCAWSPATIRWGYRDTMNEPEPSTLQLSITVPDGHPLPRYGQLIRVATKVRWTTPDSDDLVDNTFRDIFVGQIDGAARRRVTLSGPRVTPVVKGWAIDITASGPIAALARRQLSDTPWPRQGSYARMMRILELLGPEWGVLYEAAGPGGGTLRERDVDNFQALDAIRRTHAGQNLLLTEGLLADPTIPYGIIFATPDLPNVFRRASAGGQVELSESVLVPHVPAASILDTPRDLDVGSVINSIAFRYESTEDSDPFSTWEYTTRTHVVKSPESIELYGESQWQTNSDAITVSAPLAEALSRILDRRAQERWTLNGPVAIDMKHWTNRGSMPFLPRLAWYSPAARIVHIDDAPADVAPQQRVIGGVVTLHGDPDKQGLKVYLEQPDATLGTAALTIGQSSQLLISETQNVTFNDARTVSDVEIY